MDNINVTDDLLKWLNHLLALHISPDLSVSHSDNAFTIHHLNTPQTITIPIISSLWQHGCSEHLPCGTYQTLPAPASNNIEALTTQDKNNTSFHYDVFGLAYFMLCRTEEIGNKRVRDKFDRFPASASHAYKHQYLNRPLVDEWFILLKKTFVTIWPDLITTNHQFTMTVTHDVDAPSLYGFLSLKGFIKQWLSYVIRHKRYSDIVSAPYIWLTAKSKLSKLDRFNVFDWLMDVSEKNNIKSEFYFFGGKTDIEKDAHYSLSTSSIRTLLKTIHSRGHIIGLHPSFNTYLKPDILKNEFQHLKNTCHDLNITQTQWGGRMHYLRWQHPTTLNAWNDADLDYDSTLGYADYAGFRCGTCRPYKGFDPLTHKILLLEIRSLIAMECSVLNDCYMGLNETEALEYLIKLKDTCRKVDGNFVILWHNSYFQKASLKMLYQAVIESQPATKL